MNNCCCNNPFPVGCVSPCEPLALPLDPTTGTYFLQWKFAGALRGSTFTHTAGEPFAPELELNEDASATLKVYDSTGTLVLYTDEAGIEYDCFSFTTKPVISY